MCQFASLFSKNCVNSAEEGQPCPKGLLGVENGSSEKALENSSSRVSKNIGDFDCLKMAAGFVISLFMDT